jgi:hypothetical protein
MEQAELNCQQRGEQWEPSRKQHKCGREELKVQVVDVFL